MAKPESTLILPTGKELNLRNAKKYQSHKIGIERKNFKEDAAVGYNDSTCDMLLNPISDTDSNKEVKVVLIPETSRKIKRRGSTRTDCRSVVDPKRRKSQQVD